MFHPAFEAERPPQIDQLFQDDNIHLLDNERFDKFKQSTRLTYAPIAVVEVEGNGK